MWAAEEGRLEIVQLLVSFGADLSAVDNDGDTASAAALYPGHQTTADCLDAIAGWPAFKVAVGCRLHADARTMLKHGTIDPSGCTRAELATAAAVPGNTLWEGSPAPCPATTALVDAATSSWSPSRHFLYHPGVRVSVHTVLLVAGRLRRRHAVVSSLSHDQLMMLPSSSVLIGRRIGLPNELWAVVCSFVRRSDWAALAN